MNTSKFISKLTLASLIFGCAQGAVAMDTQATGQNVQDSQEVQIATHRLTELLANIWQKIPGNELPGQIIYDSINGIADITKNIVDGGIEIICKVTPESTWAKAGIVTVTLTFAGGSTYAIYRFRDNTYVKTLLSTVKNAVTSKTVWAGLGLSAMAAGYIQQTGDWKNSSLVGAAGVGITGLYGLGKYGLNKWKNRQTKQVTKLVETPDSEEVSTQQPTKTQLVKGFSAKLLGGAKYTLAAATASAPVLATAYYTWKTGDWQSPALVGAAGGLGSGLVYGLGKFRNWKNQKITTDETTTVNYELTSDETTTVNYEELLVLIKNIHTINLYQKLLALISAMHLQKSPSGLGSQILEILNMDSIDSELLSLFKDNYLNQIQQYRNAIGNKQTPQPWISKANSSFEKLEKKILENISTLKSTILANINSLENPELAKHAFNQYLENAENFRAQESLKTGLNAHGHTFKTTIIENHYKNIFDIFTKPLFN